MLKMSDLFRCDFFAILPTFHPSTGLLLLLRRRKKYRKNNHVFYKALKVTLLLGEEHFREKYHHFFNSIRRDFPPKPEKTGSNRPELILCHNFFHDLQIIII
jgi:hypothetical protein